MCICLLLQTGRLDVTNFGSNNLRWIKPVHSAHMPCAAKKNVMRVKMHCQDFWPLLGDSRHGDKENNTCAVSCPNCSLKGCIYCVCVCRCGVIVVKIGYKYIWLYIRVEELLQLSSYFGYFVHWLPDWFCFDFNHGLSRPDILKRRSRPRIKDESLQITWVE